MFLRVLYGYWALYDESTPAERLRMALEQRWMVHQRERNLTTKEVVLGVSRLVQLPPTPESKQEKTTKSEADAQVQSY